MSRVDAHDRARSRPGGRWLQIHHRPARQSIQRIAELRTNFPALCAFAVALRGVHAQSFWRIAGWATKDLYPCNAGPEQNASNLDGCGSPAPRANPFACIAAGHAPSPGCGDAHGRRHRSGALAMAGQQSATVDQDSWNFHQEVERKNKATVSPEGFGASRLYKKTTIRRAKIMQKIVVTAVDGGNGPNTPTGRRLSWLIHSRLKLEKDSGCTTNIS